MKRPSLAPTMSAARRLIQPLALLLLPSVAFALGTLPCAPDGGSTTLTANPDLQADGIPVGAKVIGAPIWYDKDLLTNQELGEGNPIKVENKGGNLSGPNGKVVNGGLDGDCIEIGYKVLLRYKVTVKVCASSGSQVGAGGSSISAGSSECESTTVWKSKWFAFWKGDLCPC